MTKANDIVNFMDAKPDPERNAARLIALRPTPASEVVDELLAMQTDEPCRPTLNLQGVRQQDIETEILGRILELQKLMIALPLIPASK